MAHTAEDLLSFRRLLKSRTKWRAIAIISIIIAICMIFWASLDGGSAKSDHIARIKINNVISTDDARAEMLREIAKDEQVKAIIVRINSPGGTTAGSEALFENLRKVGKQKPVIAVVDELAASGGYIAALASDHIIVRETSIVGSIGVLVQWGEIGELMKTVGVKLNTIKSDPRKAEPDISKPITPEGRAVLEKIVSDSHGWFLRLVETRRSLEKAEARRLGDGRVYSGSDAVALKLADAIGDDETAKTYLAENHELKDLEFIDYSPNRGSGFDRFLSNTSVAETIASSIFGIKIPSQQPLEGLLALWHPAI